jgi:RNA polymerase sigma-70 factor (ECF subfamily)
VDHDQILVQQAAGGNRLAFDELINRHHGRIYQLVRILTGNDPDTEDLTQETFIRAFRGLGTFRGTSTFVTWIHRIAVNVARTHMARGRQQGASPWRHAHSGNPFDRADDPPAPDDVETDVGRRLHIDRALATLPGDLRVLITLRDVQGLDYREIAEITGQPIGSVASGVFRARRRLRPILAPLMARAPGA